VNPFDKPLSRAEGPLVASPSTSSGCNSRRGFDKLRRASGQACSVDMLALQREQEGAEVLNESEGQGSGEEPENAAVKNPPA